MLEGSIIVMHDETCPAGRWHVIDNRGAVVIRYCYITREDAVKGALRLGLKG